MVRAKCPFCGKDNDVGLMEPVRPGDPTPMMQSCPHFVFFSAHVSLIWALILAALLGALADRLVQRRARRKRAQKAQQASR